MIQVKSETVQFILTQLDEDIAHDCCNIITKLLKSLFVRKLGNNEEVFSSAKVLLNLYESLNSNGTNIKSEFPLSLLIENIKLILQCNNENCNLPGSNVQLNILSIISSVFEIGVKQKSLEVLAEFFDYNRTCIGKTECKSDCLIFKLKILTLLYQALANTKYESLGFNKKIKQMNYSEENELLANLALHEDDKIAFQTLFHLIPAQINYYQSNRVLKVIWKRISTFKSLDKSHSRELMISCQIFDKCILKDKMDFTKLLFEDVNYWKLVQIALKDEDAVKRKQGLYLFKKTLDVLNTGNVNILCNNNGNIFYWHSDYKSELYKLYSDIIIILEFLEEQQIHIIKPIFNLIETVIKKILNSTKMNFSWILVIYKKAIMHENLQVVKWALNSLLKTESEFFLDENIVRETAELLAVILNNMSLYYNNPLTISEQLRTFFLHITSLRTCKIFFSTFIKKLFSQVWSAEALFFVTQSLSFFNVKNRKCSFLGNEEISKTITFVLKAFRTHNRIIRSRVQSDLFKACLNFMEKDLAFENFITLISIFYEREILKIGSQEWEDLIHWLKKVYSRKDGKNILDKYFREKSMYESKHISLAIILFYYAYDSEFFSNLELNRLEMQNENKFAVKYFKDILLSYKEIHKRAYCNKQVLDQNLSIICEIYKISLQKHVPEFVKFSDFTNLNDVILYIQTQLSQISNLRDLSDLELYLNTFECITKTLKLCNFDIQYADNFYMEILKDLKSGSNISSIGMFWRIRILKILIKSLFIMPKPSSLDFYLLKSVNEPLKKDDDHLEKTRDLLTLWGRLNSEFLEDKWIILKCLINNKIVVHGCEKMNNSYWVSNDDLVMLCIEALNTGGYGVLCPVMSILKNLLPAMESEVEVKKIIDYVWKLVLERKKTEEFKGLVGEFVEMVFQHAFIDKEESTRDILLEYADLIFSHPNLAVVNIFMKHIQRVEITKSLPLFCHIVGKGLIFGPVEMRDERLTHEVCFEIESLEIFTPMKMSDYNRSNEVRAKAVQKVLQLDKNSPAHQAIARQLIDTLLNLETKLSKNRSRYFGNSHVHRLKHRLMQALLLLEPMLSENEDEAKKLSNWVIQCLISENSQPSVRFMQEWLLIRMIVRHSHLFSAFSITNHYNDWEESKKKAVCSLIGVIYHSCQLLPSHLIEEKVAYEIRVIFNLCFHRHFELRLYAQVVFCKLYEFVKLKNFNEIIQNYEIPYKALTEYFGIERKKNKNLIKLLDYFYFQGFHPLENYTLETIYTTLPKLLDVGSDEWISVEMFLKYGVKPSEISILLKDKNSLELSLTTTGNKWLLEPSDCFTTTEFDERKYEKFLDNYQKKVIPIKPGWNEDDNCYRNTFKTGGLIVVASLIDRIPNLGGLARTCEVFGASEYIINSLRYTEDKQFTSLSVTAEKWITVKEVKIQDLLDYVYEMKENGYSIIGAEQTLHSQPLNAVKFPEKSLLLLGNEKEGIPPNLLPFLDVCVEIPQLGLIRSLNVHVTGALFIWEYAKQHHFPLD